MKPEKTKKPASIELGQMYQDTLTGVTGVVTKHCRNYQSPNTVLIEWRVGKAVSKEWIIEDRLQEVAA